LPVRFIASLLPRRLAHLVAQICATAVFLASPGLRKRIFSNLLRAGHSPTTHLGLKTLLNYAKSLIDYPYLSRVTPFNYRDFVNIPEAPWPKGSIILSCHLGQWEWIGIAGAILGYRINGVIKDSGDRLIQRYRSDVRGRFGIRSHKDWSARLFWALCKGIGRGECVATLIDRGSQSKHAIKVDFLGRLYNFPPGPLLIALRTGAPIIPVICLLGLDHYSIVVESPVYIRGTEELAHGARHLASVFGRYISANPTQWFNFG
jgi:KDO2-lipid IV(A) lauroyltransferase